MDDESMPVEPDDNVAGCLFEQTVQNAAFDVA
jgi:hypothetical protein